MSYRRLARFNKKAPTSNKPPYLVFNPHSLPPLVHSSTIHAGTDYLNGAFIDPGIKNCAVRIAQYDRKRNTVTTIMQYLFDFTVTETTSGVGADTGYYSLCYKLLDQYLPYFQHCHYIVLESQLAINYDLIRMGQHLISYFLLSVKDKGFRPLIIEIDSHLKSRMLNAPRMKKPELKKWARTTAIQILTARGDTATAKMIEGSRKGDDHGDTVLYEVVWWMILQHGLNTPPVPTPPRPVSTSRFVVTSSTPANPPSVLPSSSALLPGGPASTSRFVVG